MGQVTATVKADGVTEYRDDGMGIAEAELRHPNELLAIACHELRTPLACAGNAIRLLTQPTTDARARDQLHDMLERQVRLMSQLVEDLLSTSQDAHAGLSIRRLRVNLRTVLEHVIETHAHSIAAKKHHLSIGMPDGSAWILGDMHRLEQVFSNLLGNATKFTPPGGRISLWTHQRPDSVVVRIRDSGIGIAQTLLPGIFELYRRTDDVHSHDPTGLGIGLTVVRELVELHGGSVTAASGGAGRGSEFTVCLPLAARAGSQ